MQKHSSALLMLLMVVTVVPLGAQAPSPVDLNAIYQIKDEGFNRSQIMDTMSYLTDVYGPRLTNSPNIKQAADWTMGKMKEWQLANVHLEHWGPFGKGWSNDRFSLQVISPRPFPLIAYAKAWTPGTN
ncbi:MAG TPA: peptidase M28, partial [Candidatus Dormibacteraeota bacterium]|nr:peptidase M28 [Candidatus Dormibacteraeota bacterium]